jgi:hypothetical protein
MEAGTGVTQSQVKEEEDGSSPGAFGGSVGLLHLGFELALLNYELIDWVVLQASPNCDNVLRWPGRLTPKATSSVNGRVNMTAHIALVLYPTPLPV